MGQRYLWERQNALEAVERCLAGARAGQGRALLFVGEAGLGKTAVLDHAVRGATADMDVGLARGEPMEGALAFGLATQALRALPRSRAVGLGAPSGVKVAEPAAPYHRLLRWLEARTDRPLLLALDDLHWSDTDSLQLFAFAMRRLARLPVAVVGTLRPWPTGADAVVRDLVAGGHADLLRLDPLSEPSSRALLADRSGETINDADAQRSWALCQGNPLLVEQLALALAQGDGVPASSALQEQLLLARFAGLDEAGLLCARAASVLGATFRPEIAAELAGLQGREIDSALDGLCRSGVVVECGDAALRFAHPLFAQALYDDLPAPVRRRHHARAFSTLAARGLDGEASEHAIRAELVGDEHAVSVLERAGRAALAAGAVVTAAHDFQAAVRFSGDHAAPLLLLALAEALTGSGRMQEAAGVCRRLLDGDELAWPDRLETLRMLGRAHYLTGAAGHGDAAFAEAAELAVSHDPARAIRPLLDRTLSAWLAGGPALALPYSQRARELARDADPALREAADASWGHVALEAGDPEGLAATAPLARYLDEGVGTQVLDAAELVWPWASIYMFAQNAVHAERYDDAERALTLARTVVERAGAANALATVAIYIANLAIRRGRLEEALAEAVRATEFADLTPGVMPYAELVRADALAWMGRFDESRRCCDVAETHASEQWFVRLWLAHVRGMLALWQGDAAASDLLLSAERITHAAGIREPCHMHWAGHAITAHLAAGRPDDAVRVIAWLEDCARPLPCRWPAIVATLGRAQLAAHAGDAVAAEPQFAAALAMHADIELPLHRLEALLAYGGFLRRAGRSVQARPRLLEALRLAEASGAGWLMQTAALELRLAGGKRRRGNEARDGLTAAQRRVAELAAAGHSNAEIARQLYLSVNTVQTHLKHIYSKLGINSRRELMTREHELLA